MSHTPDSVKADTERDFPIGCQVVREGKKKIVGVVERHSMGGLAVYGFEAVCCLNIRWGTNKTLDCWHKDYIRRYK